jgi:hypothetical protein
VLTEKEEKSLQIHAFATGLEEAIDKGPLAIAHHLAHLLTLLNITTRFVSSATALEMLLDGS